MNASITAHAVYSMLRSCSSYKWKFMCSGRYLPIFFTSLAPAVPLFCFPEFDIFWSLLISDIMQYFCDSLISRRMNFSSFTHHSVSGRISFLKSKWYECEGIYILHFFYPFICWWTLELIPCLGYCNTVMNMGVQVSLQHTHFISC